MKGGPEEVLVLAGFPHMGRVCAFCKSPYFEQLSNDKLTTTSVLSPDGKKMVMEAPSS